MERDAVLVSWFKGRERVSVDMGSKGASRGLGLNDVDNDIGGGYARELIVSEGGNSSDCLGEDEALG